MRNENIVRVGDTSTPASSGQYGLGFRVSRRQILGAAVLGGGAALLGACGSGAANAT